MHLYMAHGFVKGQLAYLRSFKKHVQTGSTDEQTSTLPAQEQVKKVHQDLSAHLTSGPFKQGIGETGACCYGDDEKVAQQSKLFYSGNIFIFLMFHVCFYADDEKVA